MQKLAELWRRLHFLLNRSRLERELEEEMAAHRAMKADGEVPFGNLLKLREESNDIWGWGWLDRVRQDVKFGARLLRRSPTFTITALAVLTLGVGTNIAAFQVLNAVAFHPLPVREPETLVRFERRAPQGTASSFSYPAFRFYADHNAVLDAAMAVHGAMVAFDDDPTREVSIQFVSANYLSQLGAAPAFGRLLDPALDASPDSDPAVVLSYALWQRRFGSDPAVVGRSVRINGRPVTVIGVVSPTFVGLTGTTASHAWTTIGTHPYAFPGSDLLTNERDVGSITFFARLKPGLTRAAAEDGMRAAADALQQQGPDFAWKGEWLRAQPAGLYSPLSVKAVAPVLIAAAFAAIVLLASCTNLATLMMARGLAREREMSIRLSVGATRRRIVRQLLTESGLLSVVGTTLGLAVSFSVARILLAFGDAPSFLQPRLDARVVVFSFVIAALAAGLFGVLPALQAIRLRAPRRRTRSILVAAQVATGCSLLVVGGLLARGVQQVVTVPLGFEYADHMTIAPGLSANGFKPAAAREYWSALRSAVERVPNVSATSLTKWAPLGNAMMIIRMRDGSRAYVHSVEPSYFAVMGIPLLRGRNLMSREVGSALVSDSFARATWPSEEPLGKVFEKSTVVGVVGNARTLAVGNPVATEIYMPLREEELPGCVLVVRVKGDPSVVLTPIVRAARSIDPRVTPSVPLLRDAFEAKLETPRQMAVVVSTLGMLALSIAAIGLAGVLSFAVSERTREIGIQLALGAKARHVVRNVVRRFVWPVGAGLVGGLAGAGALSIVLRRELFGLSPLDPVSYAVAAMLFSIVAVLAAAGPLRRALRVDPVTALRAE